MSDPVPTDQLPSLEVRMDDLRAVMDEVGSDRAVIYGASESGALALLFAATYVLLKLIAAVVPLRANAEEEALGMDLVAHGEEAYATGEGAILVELPEPNPRRERALVEA